MKKKLLLTVDPFTASQFRVPLVMAVTENEP